MTDLTKPADVADLFVETCKRLRDMGATRVEAFGLVAFFQAPPAPQGEQRQVREPEPEKLSPEEREVAARLKQIVRNV